MIRPLHPSPFKDASLGKSKRKPTKDAEMWQVIHLEKFRAATLPWPPTIEEPLASELGHVSQRMREVAYYYSQVRSDKDVDSWHDINMSLKMVSKSAAVLPTIVSSSVVFSVAQQRVLLGGELMAMQGFPQRLMTQMRGTWPSNHQLTEMAGDSFNAFVMSAIMFSVLVCLRAPEFVPMADSDFESAGTSDDSDQDSSNELDDDCCQIVPGAMMSSGSESA